MKLMIFKLIYSLHLSSIYTAVGGGGLLPGPCDGELCGAGVPPLWSPARYPPPPTVGSSPARVDCSCTSLHGPSSSLLLSLTRVTRRVALVDYLPVQYEATIHGHSWEGWAQVSPPLRAPTSRCPLTSCPPMSPPSMPLQSTEPRRVRRSR